MTQHLTNKGLAHYPADILKRIETAPSYQKTEDGCNISVEDLMDAQDLNKQSWVRNKVDKVLVGAAKGLKMVGVEKPGTALAAVIHATTGIKPCGGCKKSAQKMDNA